MQSGTAAQRETSARAPMPSLGRNVVANYLSQLYMAVAGIALVPVYIHLMGSEAYGLVGFFAMLQSWLLLLDLGLSATVSRETARYLGGGYSALEMRTLLRAMEGVFWAVAVLAATALILLAPQIADRWLNAESLSDHGLSTSLAMMAVAVASRWLSGLYRGVLVGLERQVWLGTCNIAVTTARFFGVVPLLLWIAPTPVVFFAYQAVISLLELAVLLGSCYRFVPLTPGARVRWSLRPLRATLKFSAAVALTSSSWVLVTQLDKLLMSKLLTLTEYGWFTAAVLAASGINLIGGPIAQALLPRMTRLSQVENDAEVINLYRRATQVVAAACGTAALTLALFAEKILWLWTNDAVFGAGYGTVLALYALGNGLLAVGAFPYYLQYARGDLRLHVIGSLIFVALLVPGVLLLTPCFGAVGAGAAWLSVNAAFLLFWTPLVHRRFAPALHGRWLMRDIGGVVAPPLLVALAVWWMMPEISNRLVSFLFIVATGATMFGCSLYQCELVRPKMRSVAKRIFRSEER
jgi:O-antigen/teichoic acid export membrane protein